MLYRLIRLIVSIGIKIYYKEIRVVNKQFLDKEYGPLILIANHPNTLMDAWMIGYVSSRKVHFMAKATFFNSRFKRKLLHILGIIPINRKNDRAVSGINNKDSFEACYDLLEKGGVLVVFPEGTSFLERKLREIKTGTARIAIEAEQRNNGKLGLKVIPIGLNYISANSYRGSVLIQVGESIPVASFVSNKMKVSDNALKLTEKFRSELSRVFVNLENSEREVLVEKIKNLFVTKYSEYSSVSKEVAFIRKVQEKLDEHALTKPWIINQIEDKTDSIISILVALGLKNDFLDRPFRRGLFIRQFIQSWFFLLTATPLFIYGLIHHFIPYYLIGKMIPKLTKEPEYQAPLAVIFGLILYPLNYFLFFIGLNILFTVPWWGDVLYVTTLPLAGTFTHFYLRYMTHIRSKLKFAQFAKTRRTLLVKLKEDRETLKNLIFKD